LEDSLAEIEREYENERFEVLRKEREQREYEQRQEARELRLTELRREIAGIRRWREIRTVRQNLRKITIPQREPIVAKQVLNEPIGREVSNDNFEKRAEDSIASLAKPRRRPERRIHYRRRIRHDSRKTTRPKQVRNFAPKNADLSPPLRSSVRCGATTTTSARRRKLFSSPIRRFQSSTTRPRPPPMPPPIFRTTRSNLRIGFSTTTHRSKLAKLLSPTSTICFYEETIRPSTIYEFDGEIRHGVIP